MELEAAVEAYHQRCQLYVWEVFDVLSSRYPGTYRILTVLAQHEESFTVPEIIKVTKAQQPRGQATPSRATLQHHLLLLSKLGFLHRQSEPQVPKAGGHQYSHYRYTLTDFGRLIAACGQRGGQNGTAAKN